VPVMIKSTLPTSKRTITREWFLFFQLPTFFNFSSFEADKFNEFRGSHSSRDVEFVFKKIATLVVFFYKKKEVYEPN
jgi:hypothetical protein